MTLRSRLYAIFSLVVLGTAALAVAGYVLALQFSNAIYEIGVVRFPSVSGLEEREEAARTIGRLSHPRLLRNAPVPRLRCLEERRERAWSRFDGGRKTYEPLPQTGAEAALWTTFVGEIEDWRSTDAEVARLLAALPPDAPHASRGEIEVLARRGRSGALLALRRLRDLRQINVNVATAATHSTVATLRDASRIQEFMMGLGILALSLNLWLALRLNRSIARPIADAESVIRRITEGDLTARAAPGADDETGRLVDSVNRLASALENSEASRQAIGANLPSSIIYQAVYEPVRGPRFLHVSPNVEQIAGVSRSALYADPTLLDQWIEEEDRQALVQARAAVVATGKPLDLTVRARNAAGKPADLHITSATRRMPDGSILSDGVITDVTARLDSERRLAALARNLRTISRCRHAVVHAVDEKSLLQEVCSAIVENGSYRTVWVASRVEDEAKSVRCAASAGALPDYPLGSRTRWDDSPLGRGPVGSALRTGQVEIREDVQHDADTEPWRKAALAGGVAAAFAFPLKENGVPFAALAIYSIDPGPVRPDELALLKELAADLEFGILALRARQKLDQSLRELRISEERFRQAMEQSPIGMAISHFDGRSFEVNQVLCDITGYSRDELIGMTFQQITHPEDLEQDVEMRSRVLAGEMPGYELEKRYIRKDGSIAWVEIYLTLVRDGSGTPLYFVG